MLKEQKATLKYNLDFIHDFTQGTTFIGASTLLAIIVKHDPISECPLLCQVLWGHVCADDWAAERATIASNVMDRISQQ